MESVTYLSAVEAFGHVPLGRACRFSALLKELRLAAAPAPVEDDEDLLVAVRAEDVPETPGGAANPADVQALFEATVLPLHAAIVDQGRFADVAAVVCVARGADGALRDVTEAEAASDAFPSDVFTTAFSSFIAAGSSLSMMLVGTPTGTA